MPGPTEPWSMLPARTTQKQGKGVVSWNSKTCKTLCLSLKIKIVLQAEGLRQLASNKFYTKHQLAITDKHKDEINSFLFSMLNNGGIDLSVYDYLYSKEYNTAENAVLTPPNSQRYDTTKGATHSLNCQFTH